MNGAGDEYLRTKVMTASPYKLHLMVIDEMLRHSRQALKSIDSEDFETSHTETVRAREYCAEVLSGIRNDAAPDLAASHTELRDGTQPGLQLGWLLQHTAKTDRIICRWDRPSEIPPRRFPTSVIPG